MKHVFESINSQVNESEDNKNRPSKETAHIMKLTDLTTDLLLYPLTKQELYEFDIHPYNSFERARYFCIDTGDEQQVVFAINIDNGEIYVEEDTDYTNIETSFDSIEEFVHRYRDLTGRSIRESISQSVYKQLDDIDDEDSLNEKCSTKNLKKFRKLHEFVEDTEISNAVKTGFGNIIETTTLQLEDVIAELESSLVEYTDKYKHLLKDGDSAEVKKQIDILIKYVQIQLIDKLNKFNKQL